MEIFRVNRILLKIIGVSNNGLEGSWLLFAWLMVNCILAGHLLVNSTGMLCEISSLTKVAVKFYVLWSRKNEVNGLLDDLQRIVKWRGSSGAFSSSVWSDGSMQFETTYQGAAKIAEVYTKGTILFMAVVVADAMLSPLGPSVTSMLRGNYSFDVLNLPALPFVLDTSTVAAAWVVLAAMDPIFIGICLFITATVRDLQSMIMDVGDG